MPLIAARLYHEWVMSLEQKRDEARRRSLAMRGKIKGALWLPIPPAILCWGWFKKLFCRPATRGEEQDHQAEIRRKLRGLPAEHDGGQPPTPTTKGSGTGP